MQADVIRYQERIVEKPLPVECITKEEGFYLYGYFDKCPWDITDRYVLGHNVPFIDRAPMPEDRITIGMIDTYNGNKFIPLTETSAFCWQMASLAQWTNNPSGTEIIYNDRAEDHFISVIMDVKTGIKRVVDSPVFCISPDGKHGLSVNFSRLDIERPGYGYPGFKDPSGTIDHPKDDGIFLVDLEKNTSKLIISLDDIVKINHLPTMDGVINRVYHLLFSPDGKRFVFFHRWRMPDGWHSTRMFTANYDGTDIYPLNIEEMTSHYTWIDNSKIIAYANRNGIGWRYFEFTDKTQDIKIIGDGLFDGDGHCTYSPDRKWMLTDTYPDKEHYRSLMVYNLEKGIRYNIGRFYSGASELTKYEPIAASLRCDLHPRFSRKGDKILIDSLHEGPRKMYVINMAELLNL